MADWAMAWWLIGHTLIEHTQKHGFSKLASRLLENNEQSLN